ncbi:MAG: hypothetical protein IKX36_09605 [Prevotella sp.]|nr:hypothetical protein [Prevotella sp.]
MSAKYQLSLDDMASGWGSTYDPATKTISFDEEAWGGRGWWMAPDNVPLNYIDEGVEYIVVKVASATINPKLCVQYTDGTLNEKNELNQVSSAEASFTQSSKLMTLKLDENYDKLIQIYIQNGEWRADVGTEGGNPAGEVVLLDAYLATEEEYQAALAEGPQASTGDVIINGDCSSDDTSCFVAYEWLNSDARNEGPARIVDGAVQVYVRSQAQAEAAGNPTLDDKGAYANWDSQFFITFGEENALKDGDKLQLKMKVKADKEATVGTQCHTAPGGYIHWYAAGDVPFTTQWSTYESKEIPVATTGGWEIAQAGTYTIAFNLALGDENTFYFDDMQLLVTRTSGITKIINVKPVSTARYNLAGQRVSDSYKGVVIQNGRKFIQK